MGAGAGDKASGNAERSRRDAYIREKRSLWRTEATKAARARREKGEQRQLRVCWRNGPCTFIYPALIGWPQPWPKLFQLRPPLFSSLLCPNLAMISHKISRFNSGTSFHPKLDHNVNPLRSPQLGRFVFALPLAKYRQYSAPSTFNLVFAPCSADAVPACESAVDGDPRYIRQTRCKLTT